MSIRTLVINTVEEHQQKLDAIMRDRNGKKLVVGDVVETKRDIRGSKFLRMGVVLGAKEGPFGDYFLKISSSNSPHGYKIKFPHNVRKANRNKMILFKLEN